MQHTKTCQHVAEYNVYGMLHELTSGSRYSVCLLYYHKSTNTDAEGAASRQGLNLLDLLVKNYK